MRLSIIIPVYNVENFLSTCLDSLLMQELELNDYEIIIVDDGSEDNSLSLARSYSNRYKQVKTFSKENGGVGSARNLGIEKAKGKYIYFIDPDDYLLAKTLKLLVEIIESNDLDILTFRTKLVQQSTLNECITDTTPTISKIQNGIDYIATYKYNNEVWWYLINREFLLKTQIKFIENRWMEDAIFTVELFLKAQHMAHCNLIGHRHLITPGTAMTSKEQNHYIKVIRDNYNAALVFNPILQSLENTSANPKCIERIKTYQQSFVFFLMMRMLKSTIQFKEVKAIINDLQKAEIYPLNSFLGSDFNGTSYKILTRLINKKRRFYFTFLLFNPIMKLKYRLSDSI